MNVAVRPRARLALLALGLLAGPPRPADAAGFEIYNQGARAMGFAGAYVAQAYDPSAIYFNAAGVGLPQGQAHLPECRVRRPHDGLHRRGPYPPVGHPRDERRRPRNPPEPLLHAAGGGTLGRRCGLLQPVRLPSASGRTPTSSPAATSAPSAAIRARNLNPTVAFKIADRLAIGAGVNLLFASFDHQQRLLAEPNPFPEPTDVAELTIDGASDTELRLERGPAGEPVRELLDRAALPAARSARSTRAPPTSTRS